MTTTCKILTVGFAVMAISSATAADTVTSPWATGGEVTAIDQGNSNRTYIHTFTNANEVAKFASTGKRALSVRYLVVGAGGAGGKNSYWSTQNSAPGGGGGGVCEVANVTFAAGTEWKIKVGKGASTSDMTAAESSSISNGLVAVSVVPGGGNGGCRTDKTSYVEPTTGAGGGGGTPISNAGTAGAAGTYASSIKGISPAEAPFAGGNADKRQGGGGGGAGGAGGNCGRVSSATVLEGKPFGGAGVVSDITGESLTYGAGGGGGECYFINGTTTYLYQGGNGGDRAGNGAKFVQTDDGISYVAATDPVPNSGAGGGGRGNNGGASTDGADGIVVIRYTIVESPCSGGDIITRVQKSEGVYTYLHVFTNPATVSTFANQSGSDIRRLRHLVVGAGGAGGKNAYWSTQNSAPGGGGGGVCEVANVTFAAGTEWKIKVGKGASASDMTAAESSSISNGLVAVSVVPGGGNGGCRTDKTNYIEPTTGAGGGGGTPISNGGTVGAAGTYASSIKGISPADAPFAGGTADKRQGGGGGGAGGAGGNCGRVSSATVLEGAPFGGAGVVSDITGESLTYGAGGGGGECYFINSGTTYLYQGGNGGDRAGNGSKFVQTDDGISYVAATEPAPNSGAGGGGRGNNGGASTDGADGIVVIRYDWSEVSRGLVVVFR